jgi:hypothetical protein
MFSEGDLAAEIQRLIDAKITEGRRAISPEWLAHEIIKGRPLASQWESDEAREFYRNCTYGFVRGRVREAVRTFKKETERVGTLPLPGFDCVQQAYSIERRGQPRIVPIGLMTLREIEHKAVELERLADGARRHARELRRYALARKGKRKAG